MIKTDLSELMANKIRRDAVEVEVFNNDINSAVKRLHRKMQEAGVLRVLKLRRDNPRKQDRRKAKKMRAKSNRLRLQARRQAKNVRNKTS